METSDKGAEGNTISSAPSSKKRVVPGKYWCATFYNNDMETLESYFSPICDKGIIGKETCPTTGKEHFQCFFAFKVKCRPVEAHGHRFKGNQSPHWEKTKGNAWQNYDYCSKDGNFVNWGFPEDYRVQDSDLSKDMMRIVDLFRDRCDRKCRKIYWFWESVGNWGKSTCAIYMVDWMNALVVGGKDADIKCGVADWVDGGKEKKELPIIVVDIPRVNKGGLSIQALEAVKNGCFFSGKYKSSMCRYAKPHIIIFSNQYPDMVGDMSADRWVITELKKDWILGESSVPDTCEIVTDDERSIDEVIE